MDKKYYIELAERWFEAETTEAEERELRAFLATTDDPAFDEARAAFGYLAAEAAASAVAKPVAVADAPRKVVRFWPAVAVAAGVAVAFVLGRMSATPVEVVVEGAGNYVSYVHGVEVPGEEFAVREMETTLSDLFAPSASPDPTGDLQSIFNRNE